MIVICAIAPLSGVWADLANRDPTRPPQGTPARANVVEVIDAPKLSSVLIGHDRKLAVINGKLLGEGERWSGMKVWEIHPDRVVVSLSGQKAMTLMLDGARVHKDVR